MDVKRIVQVEKVKKVYGIDANKTAALKGLTFDVIEGEFLGIMGASGSGKTTLLNCIATMTRPTSGRILLNGRDITSFKDRSLAEYRSKTIGYLFQEFELLDNLTGSENIMLPLAIHGIGEREAAAAIKKLALRFDINDILEKFPPQMSGGQKQRIGAARALITNPAIVLADEPTGALDSANARILMDMLALINSEHGKTILMVTHNANAASYCSRILFIKDGQLVHELRKKTATENNDDFYERIVSVMSQQGGGRGHVL